MRNCARSGLLPAAAQPRGPRPRASEPRPTRRGSSAPLRCATSSASGSCTRSTTRRSSSSCLAARPASGGRRLTSPHITTAAASAWQQQWAPAPPQRHRVGRSQRPSSASSPLRACHAGSQSCPRRQALGRSTRRRRPSLRLRSRLPTQPPQACRGAAAAEALPQRLRSVPRRPPTWICPRSCGLAATPLAAVSRASSVGEGRG